MSYLDELGRALGAAGIRGRLCSRILAETDDHLRSGGEPEAFGDPREVANAFAAELGTHDSRRAALAAFAALGVTGAFFAAAFVSLRWARIPDPNQGEVAALLALLGAQVAFVAGTLALLRALRRRRERVLPTAELAVLNRRTGTALAAGLVTVGGVALYAYQLPELAAWWRTFALAGSGASAGLLLAASASFVPAARLRPQVAGAAGDLFDDLPLGPYRGDPWRFARHVAVLVFAAVTLAGILQGDPFDGALRGLLEAAACLSGFAVFGKYLGLRR